MSHFTVLVIGDNPEEQLAPYHEFECTGLDDQYVMDLDETQMSWPQIREKYCPKHGEAELSGGIEAAREAYHAQPAVKALREVERFRFEDAEDYVGDREEFIRRAGIEAYMTHAVVKDGYWYECGEMGWFGMVLNEKNGNAWADEFSKLIDGLQDDILLSVYDCHI